MPETSDVISFSDAARKKGCSRATLYRAVDDGRLNGVQVSDRQMIVKDEKWTAFEPEFIGRRAQKLSDDNDSSNESQ
jgi:predicted site-specific integrase-resolvase